ncbi:MAG: sulfite exporter TauE/SafE family protein [Rhodocyclales bacterium]|nr:sulfite exporter TauE/SafE family protein [Rhodocyclales bacterium]
MQTLHFAASGVDTFFWLPPLAGLVLAFFCSMVGISGAFLLLPFQMSVLGFAGPAASATNMVFNLFATPGGIWRYQRDGRLLAPLAWLISVGSLPGIVLGFYIRTRWLADAAHFRLFVSIVLLYVAYRLLTDIVHRGGATHDVPQGGVGACRREGRRYVFAFDGAEHGFSIAAVLLLAFLVGIIGGTYGIGGGALISPFLVAAFGLPVHAVAGAALAGTFASSLVGVVIYALLPVPGGGSVAPDWALGSLFGLGGLAGMTLGSALQKRVPPKLLQGALGVLLCLLGGYYLL